uniref:Si:dkey-13e3.1 n=1 Tax=Paramormyrops kingsleyae TaxID=1676925 RepID=A0A3B3RAJ5_9TELE
MSIYAALSKNATVLKYILDTDRPAGELVVKDTDVCLTREDFWSLGLNRCMDSNIGNACFKVVKEVARRHGKDVHIVDMYVVPTWKTKNVDPLVGMPVSAFACIAYCINPGPWTEKTGRDLPVNILMYYANSYIKHCHFCIFYHYLYLHIYRKNALHWLQF